MRLQGINTLSVTLIGATSTPKAPTAAILASVQNGDPPPSTSITPIDSNVTAPPSKNGSDLNLTLPEEILDFFTRDEAPATQAPQLPAPMHAQYTADLNSLMEQIQLDADEELLRFLSSEANPDVPNEIQIELLDSTPDKSAQLLQTRYQILCDLLGLDAAVSTLTTPAISMTTVLKKITFHAFQSNGETRNYFWKLLQRLTTH